LRVEDTSSPRHSFHLHGTKLPPRKVGAKKYGYWRKVFELGLEEWT